MLANLFTGTFMKSRFKISFLSHLIILALSLSANAGMGGISGGGGGTVPAKPVGKEEIRHILQDARYSAYLFYATALRNDLLTDLGVKNLPQALEAIKTHGIDINTQGPCLDNNGNPNDGSVNSGNPLYICISSKTLGEKLDDINAWAQTIALVVHEYAHLAGADEGQATQIQTRALFEVNRNPLYRHLTAEGFIHKFIEYKSLIPRHYVLKPVVSVRQITDFITVNRGLSAEELFEEMTNGKRGVSLLSPAQLNQITRSFPFWDNAVQISKCFVMGSPCEQDPNLITPESITLAYDELAAKLYAIYNDIQLDQNKIFFGDFIAIDGVPSN